MGKAKRIVLIVVGIILLGAFAITFIPDQRYSKGDEETTKKNLKLLEDTYHYEDFDINFYTNGGDYKWADRAKGNDNILLLHKKEGKWNLYSLKGMKVDKELTKADLDKIDIIAFAATYSNTEHYEKAGTGDSTSIQSEYVYINLFNPKNGKMYSQALMDIRTPKKISVAKDLTYSVGEIAHVARVNCGIKVPGVFYLIRILVVVIFVAFAVFTLKKKWGDD